LPQSLKLQRIGSGDKNYKHIGEFGCESEKTKGQKKIKNNKKKKRTD
jgi:hypothetical protein